MIVVSNRREWRPEAIWNSRVLHAGDPQLQRSGKSQEVCKADQELCGRGIPVIWILKTCCRMPACHISRYHQTQCFICFGTTILPEMKNAVIEHDVQFRVKQSCRVSR
jgi:hypothetical protein